MIEKSASILAHAAVRYLVAKLRERGLLTSFYADARKARARGVRA